MKRVLLVTLQGANIGNRLQNYALQETVKKLGLEVFTPYYDIPEYDSLSKKTKNNIKLFLAYMKTQKYLPTLRRNKRERLFSDFNRKYIDNYFKISDYNVFGEYDYAITGSDQVWHKWSNHKNELNYFYLKFIDKKKRISYAASFGFDQFPVEDVQIHKNGLLGITFLSCREKKAQIIIKELTGLDSRIVLDPTLLLSKDEWNKIQKKPKNSPNKFVLVYFLGQKNLEYRRAIDELSKQNNLRIIDVFDDHSDYYYTTPDEFLWFVENADFICTDSFHACVFSILYHKKFLAFRRCEYGMENMFNRIETLFDCFGIDRTYDGNIAKINNEYKLNDISELKKYSIDFLRNALS